MARITGMAALALGFAAAPALADVTPQQVWEDLKVYMEGFGYTVAGTESLGGDVLTVTGAEMAFPMPEDEGALTFSMDSVTFTDLGDGTVAVAFPSRMPIALSFQDGDMGEEVEMTIDYTQENLALVVSGEPGALVYSYTADSLGMALADLTVDGEVITRDMARMDVDMGPMEGRSTVTRDGALQTVAQDMSMGTLTYDLAFADPEGGESARFTGSLTGVGLSGESAVPMNVDMTDMLAAVAAGLSGNGRITHQGGSLEFTVDEGYGATTGQMSSTSGELDVTFAGDALAYLARGTGSTLALTGPDIPFPVNVELAESAFSLTMPLMASEAPQEAELALTLGGFAMSDMLWNIFDPGTILPRDPATISFDLLAQVTPYVSILDADAMAEIEDSGEAPGELNALSLRSLLVEAAGGKITGTGDFTFDNTDLDSFDGMPRPEGQVDLQVSGANGLIDRLIQMGLMQEQDAMGARMMLSMFTVPGEAPDTATSRIEINADGHILANGQRIQ